MHAEPTAKGQGDVKTFLKSSYPKPLPIINGGSNEALDKVTNQAWAAIARGSTTPTLFRFAGGLVRLEEDDHGGPRLIELTTARMNHELALCAQWQKKSRG